MKRLFNVNNEAYLETTKDLVGFYTFGNNGVKHYHLTIAITDGNTTTAVEGSFAETSHATGKGILFVCRNIGGLKWKQTFDAAASLPFGQADEVPPLTENGGVIGGTNNGDIPTLTPTAAALTGSLTGTTDGAMTDVANIALSTSNTYTDAAVNSAVNAAILSTNLQLKELQVMVNKLVADNVVLVASNRELATAYNNLLESLQDADLVAS